MVTIKNVTFSSLRSQYLSLTFLGFPHRSVVKNPPDKQKTQVQSLGQEDPLEKEITTHSSILAWEIPWTGNLVGYSPWCHKELDTT